MYIYIYTWYISPFLFLIETPPKNRPSLPCFHVFHRYCLLILSPFFFAACCHHQSPINRIAIVFSLRSTAVYQTLPSQIRLFPSFPSLNTSRSSLYISHSPTTVCELFSIALRQGHIGASTSFSRLLVYLFLLSG